jgi:serine protease Do
MELSVQLGRNANERSARARIQNNMGGTLSVRAFGFDLAIQHDSVLRPEECGGPLVNLDGNVIGINISRAGRVESYALPSDLLQRLIPELKSGKFPATTQPSTPPSTQPEATPTTRPETSSPQR